MLQVKLRKLKIWNKDAITIIVVLNWFIHINVFRGVYLKQSALICITFQAVYEDSVIMERVTIICVTKFKPEFQKYKARKCNTVYQRKRVKDQYFWKTSFCLHKLVIRKHFKHQRQFVMCFMRNSLNFDKKLPYLTALTLMKPPFFVLAGFI